MNQSLNWHGIDLSWAYTYLLPNITARTRSTNHAYDILHDALVRFALTKNPQRHDQPKAYFSTIVRHLLNDSYKEQARFVMLESESSDLANEAGLSYVRPLVQGGFSPSPEHLADVQQRLHLLQNIIDCLPPRCREVFWLFRIEGMSQHAIADKLGVSLNMVERHIMRALLDLRAAKEMISGELG